MHSERKNSASIWFWVPAKSNGKWKAWRDMPIMKQPPCPLPRSEARLYSMYRAHFGASLSKQPSGPSHVRHVFTACSPLCCWGSIETDILYTCWTIKTTRRGRWNDKMFVSKAFTTLRAPDCLTVSSNWFLIGFVWTLDLPLMSAV